MLQPTGGLKSAQKTVHGGRFLLAAYEKEHRVKGNYSHSTVFPTEQLRFHRAKLKLTFNDFLQAGSHCVNVFNAEKLEFDVLVVRLVFVSFSGCTVRHCINLNDSGVEKEREINTRW